MKIAFLCRNHSVFRGSFWPLTRKLAKLGHSVCVFYDYGDPSPNDPLLLFSPCKWWNFDMQPLKDFDPDRVVVFNGTFSWCHAALEVIKKRWKTFCVELGWLPQANYSYMDPVAPGARSSVFKETLENWTPPKHTKLLMKMLRHRYSPRMNNLELPRDFILVPLQLEQDTSITYDSPYFKTMYSFVGFLQSWFPDITLAIKPHPLDLNNYAFSGAVMIPKEIRFTDIVPKAKAVIGINSTTLIESLVHGKPVATLGYNVASNKGVFLEPSEALWNPRLILGWRADPAKVSRCLAYLRGLQYRNSNPPKRIVQQILAS